MKLITYIIFIVFLFFTLNLFGQKAEKGFKNLQKKDLVKAQEAFSKIIVEDSTNCSAQFGMSICLSHENNPAADYFSAWDHFLMAKKYFDKLTDDDNAFLKEFFTVRDTERRNRTIQYNLEIEEKIIEDKLIKFVREENNLAVAVKFIAVYPNSRFYENVVHIRNHLEFRKAEKANTFESYNDFLNKYPHSAQVNEAVKARDELAFQNASKKNTLEALDDFIKKYPTAYHFYDAIKQRDQLAFDFAKKQNSIEAFDNFITRYPTSLQIPAAKTIQRKLLYDKAKQVNTLDAYNDFIDRYPEGELFVDIFNLKTNVLGQNILSEAQGNKEMVKWIKGFDSEQKNDSAGGISLTNENQIILSGTRNKLSGSGTEAWVICVDQNGKTMWNKSYGPMPQNIVKFQTLTPKGDIILGGWNAPSTDSSLRKAWLMELSTSGNGNWERNIDGKEINTLTISSNDEIFVSGYNTGDSLPQVLYLAKLNNNYQKMWSREYIHPGILTSFATTPANNLVLASGRWLWKTDAQGYILWEKYLSQGDSISSVNIVPGGIFYISGSRNNFPYIARINDQGVISWEKSFDDMTGFHFDYVIVLPDKSILTRFQGNGYVGFLSMSQKGEILKEIRFNNSQSMVSGSVVVNSLGEVFTTFSTKNFSNTEIIVCKMFIK